MRSCTPVWELRTDSGSRCDTPELPRDFNCALHPNCTQHPNWAQHPQLPVVVMPHSLTYRAVSLVAVSFVEAPNQHPFRDLSRTVFPSEMQAPVP
ncbi:unnamed protein product [Rangifer tarandus platyrhynchus]